MNRSVKAYFDPNESGACRGMAQMICQMCGKTVMEPDLEHYYEAGTENTVELCGDCREAFETANELALDQDTVSTDIYGKLLGYARGTEGLCEWSAPMVAAALGGEAWQSGGGIWLVVRRTGDGRVITISESVIKEYADEEAFEADQPHRSLLL